MDKVSVIVPVYNVEKYLCRCIDSLLNQSYQNIELILVNDASTDGSGKIMDRYAREDSRVKAFHQSRNFGVSAARNLGLDNATGDWIAFCDGDDWYLPEFAEKMLDRAQKEQADYVICSYQLTFDSASPIQIDSLAGIRKDLSHRNVIACAPISSCCHLFHRSLFETSRVRYPEGIGHSEELPVVPVLAKFASKYAIVSESLYCYYQRGCGSASNSLKNVEADRLAAIEKMKNALGPDYEQEILYHAIYTLHYGEILQLLKRNECRSALKARIQKYEELYPNYQNSKYYSRFGPAKRAFLLMERLRFYPILRLLAKIHSAIVR